MKKGLFISLLMCLVMVFVGCESRTQEPCRFNKVNVDFSVPKGSWAYDTENKWFSYYYQTSVITPSIYDYGTWTMSHEYNPRTENAYLIQLPEFQFYELPIDENTSYFYTQRIDYEVGVGYVRVYLTNSDYIYPDGWTQDEMYFHMQITY